MCYSKENILLIPKLRLKKDSVSIDYFIALKCKEGCHYEKVIH